MSWQRFSSLYCAVDSLGIALDVSRMGVDDGFFALNSAMPNLHRLYKAGQATIVHAVATPYRERSHFDGQDVLESGLDNGSAPSLWRACTLALGAGSACPSKVSAISCTTCHSGMWRNKAKPITSQTACSAGSLRRLMEALPVAVSACSIQVGSSSASSSASLPAGITASVSFNVSCSRLKRKRERVQHVPFLHRLSAARP